MKSIIKLFNYISNLIVVLFLLLLLNSCNLVEQFYKIQTKRLEINGFKSIILQDSHYSIHYFAHQHGKPPIIMLHQFSADGLTQWTNTAIRLSKNYDIIIPDLFYFGKSYRTDSNCTIYTQLDLLDKVINDCNINKAVMLLGSSYGGIVATLYSINNKENISKLFIYDSPIMFFDVKKSDSIARIIGANSTLKLLCPSTPDELKISLKAEFYRPPPIPVFIRKQMIEKMVIPNYYEKSQLLLNLTEISNNYSLIQKNQLPDTYLLWGNNDLFIPVDVCFALKNYWNLTDNQVYIFRKSAHAANLEHNRKFTKVIKTMIETTK